MRPSSPHFFPLALPFIPGFFLLLAFLVGLLEVGVLGYAYEKLGIDRRYISALLMLSLLGSYVNIPIAELRAEPMAAGREVVFFGMRYIIPSVMEWPREPVHEGRDDPRSAAGGCRRRPAAFARLGPGARLRRGQHGYSHRRRPSQPGQDPGPRRARRLDRRGRDVRRGVFYGGHRRPAGLGARGGAWSRSGERRVGEE